MIRDLAKFSCCWSYGRVVGYLPISVVLTRVGGVVKPQFIKNSLPIPGRKALKIIVTIIYLTYLMLDHTNTNLIKEENKKENRNRVDQYRGGEVFTQVLQTAAPSG